MVIHNSQWHVTLNQGDNELIIGMCCVLRARGMSCCGVAVARSRPFIMPPLQSFANRRPDYRDPRKDPNRRPIAVIYTRFSPRPDADTSLSCEKQEARCREYCEKQDYAVRAVYHDRDISGGTVPAERPALGRAIDALLPGSILVVSTRDRLARDLEVDLRIRREVADQEGRIEHADGSTPEDTPEGRLIQNIFAAFAGYERDRIRHLTRRAMARKKRDGRRVGTIPVGFRAAVDDPKRLEPEPTERAAIETARKLSADGCHSIEIARLVTEAHGPFRGRAWSARTIRRYLRGILPWEVADDARPGPSPGPGI